jgi:hypothetical protein
VVFFAVGTESSVVVPKMVCAYKAWMCRMVYRTCWGVFSLSSLLSNVSKKRCIGRESVKRIVVVT